jgi:pimeloyl-ACP methyl ester carboxylesterase
MVALGQQGKARERPMDQPRFHTMPDGRRIAFRHTPATPAFAAAPTLVFLPGYMSDMSGSKAAALFASAAAEGRGCLLVDYSGCGLSSGDFADGTLSRWRDEVLSLIAAEVTGPVLLAGSSMGGWLMLLVAERLGDRLAGMIGIAPAPDFTRWGYTSEQQAALAAGETIFEPNPYGPEPTPTYAGFYADAAQHIRLEQGLALTCPVHLIHGQRDADVPWEVSLALAAALASDKVQVTLIKDGDHRLSRAADIAVIAAAVARFYEGA